jgi:hypothetical protein
MNEPATSTVSLWEKHFMAIDEVTRRFERIRGALESAHIPFALVGGQAVALWVATKDPAAVRTTKDVDILVRRADLSGIRKAALSVAMEYFEVLSVGMLLEQDNPNPRHAVHLIWADEKVRSEYPLASPKIEEIERLATGEPVVSLSGLLCMKLMADRDHDRAHLRDMIGVNLIDRGMLPNLPPELATRLDRLLTEEGR